MVLKAVRFLKWSAVALAAALATLLAVRAYDWQHGPPLELLHTLVPPELSASEIDMSDGSRCLAAEEKAFAQVRAEVTERLEPPARHAGNRYFADSPVYPGSFARDWCRSCIMQPDGPPAGAVVLLHGLTDSPCTESPYSLRHIAQRYLESGTVAVAIRMPGHGTVPGGLSAVEWEQRTAATRLAVREARRLAGPSMPLHVNRFSNGVALAMKHAPEAASDKTLARPDRIVLIAPMIGITSLARMSSNPFLPYVLERIEAGIGKGGKAAPRD